MKADITIAVKCAPEEAVLDAAAEASFEAIELYTNDCWIQRVDQIISISKRYPFRYAIHAPADGYEPDRLATLSEQIRAEVLVIHNIYWEDELEYLVQKMKPLPSKICMENVLSAIEMNKYLRRYGLDRCLDFEHLALETNGFFEEPLIELTEQAKHIHMTGYVFGSQRWHTHIHHSPEQSIYLLNFLNDVGYSGLVVSEARPCYQTLSEFRKLAKFFKDWKNNR